MKLLEKIKNLFIKPKPVPEIPQKLKDQRAWFVDNLPKTAVSRADEKYCYDFISEISEHFNPIELENFPLTLESSENIALSKHFADLTQSYINYRKRNSQLLKEFFKETNGMLSMRTIQTLSLFLEQDDKMGEKIFITYSRLANLFLKAAQIKKQMEEKNGKKQ